MALCHLTSHTQQQAHVGSKLLLHYTHHQSEVASMLYLWPRSNQRCQIRRPSRLKCGPLFLWHRWLCWLFECMGELSRLGFSASWFDLFYVGQGKPSHWYFWPRFLNWYCSILINCLLSSLNACMSWVHGLSIIFSKAFQFDTLNIPLSVQVGHD